MKKLFLQDVSFVMAIPKENEGIKTIELYMDDGSKIMTVGEELILLPQAQKTVHWLSIKIAADVITHFNTYHNKLTSNDSNH